MAKSILCRCEVCGNSFSAYQSKKNKFCSLECYRVSQKRGDYKRGPQKPERIHSCLNCGKETVKTPSKDRKGNRCTKVFCSRPCYDAYRKVHTCKGKPRKESLTRACKGCGAEFRARWEGSGKLYCSDACWKSNRKAKPKNCLACECLFTPVKFHHTGRMISYNAGKTCSQGCYIDNIKTNEARKKKISLAFIGEKHPLWEGGKTFLTKTSFRGPDWLKIAERARKRDKHTCQRCGKSQEENGRLLDVHHVVPYHNFTRHKEANKMSNLITLCQSCHHIVEHQVEAKQILLPFAVFEQEERRAKRGEA